MPQLAPERVIELHRVVIFQVAKIDVVEQVFKAHVYFEWVISGGAKDEALAAKENTMTKGVEYESGPHSGKKWPVVPSAMWYLENQFNWSNAIELDTKEIKVLTSKDDLVLIRRVMGEFQALMPLHQFPVDVQSLELSVEIQCAANGPFPVAALVSPSFSGTHMERGFMPQLSWHSSPALHAKVVDTLLDMGPTNSKVYPTFKVALVVARTLPVNP